MSLREEVELYSKLTGKDGTREPIVRIGAYLDGYEKGKEDAEPHWIPVTENTLPEAENMYRRPTKRYLCQRESGGVRQFFVGARLCDSEGYLKDWWDWYGVKIHNAEVVAYMPLPEPFKGVTYGND